MSTVVLLVAGFVGSKDRRGLKQDQRASSGAHTPEEKLPLKQRFWLADTGKVPSTC